MANLSRVNGFKYSLILTDFNMPVMDGLIATGKLRQILGDRIPIIGTTGYASQKYHVIGKEAGMTEVVAKPIYLNVLRGLVKKYYLNEWQQFNNFFSKAK